MKKIVRKRPASEINGARKRRFEKLAQMPDSEIDFSEIPELTGKFWKNALRNPYYRPIKKQLTLRLDADVIAWLRKKGKGYQTRANDSLRDAMIRDLQKKAVKGADQGKGWKESVEICEFDETDSSPSVSVSRPDFRQSYIWVSAS